MKILIVEDETAASENLIQMLRIMEPSAEILAVLESVSQTVDWLDSHPSPDLIMMDIHLSDDSAFAIFKQTKVTAPIVFTTAYDQYAIDSFRVNSIDYLLKPIKNADLRRALDKFHHWTEPDISAYLERMLALQPAAEQTSNYLSALLI
ncbi:MAG: response regulator, partial [Bacteroidales bacterium]|nr:response regulator [Bacteroidales bacterium]